MDRKSVRRRGFALSSTRGFSLVELLVVMTLIAILSAIVFPMFVKAKQNAQVSECLSNMRQIGMGLRMYLDEYDNRFPSAVPWGVPGSARGEGQKTIQELLTPFVRNGLQVEYVGTAKLYPKRSVFSCPSDSGIPQLDNVTSLVQPMVKVWLQTGCSYEYYACNQKDWQNVNTSARQEVPWTALSPEIAVKARVQRIGAPMSSVVSPTRKAVLGDIWFWHLGDLIPPDAQNRILPDTKVAFTNTLFVDGHAARVTGSEHAWARVQQLTPWHSYTELN